VADDKDTTEKAKELLVYGPIGLAMYLRDTAPSFVRLFVARGRAELDHRKRSVGDQLGQVKAMGEAASSYGGSHAKSFLADGLAKVKARAEETIGALSALVPIPGDESAEGDDGSRAPGLADSTAPGTAPSSPPADGSTMVDSAAEVPGPTAAPTNGEVGTTPAAETAAPARAESTLAIPDYDELSASQVVDRLAGLGTEELEAIRAYELEHRARNTVLGKIDQLAR
jgi:hypothetical protein